MENLGNKCSINPYDTANMNITLETPMVDNLRPFNCTVCKIDFHFHFHLAKHLRSKFHLMNLECLGKLPLGMCAEIQRTGVSLDNIDTTDCDSSLESLQVIAQELYQRDPRHMRWQVPDQTIVKTENVMSAPTVASTLFETKSEPSMSLNHSGTFHLCKNDELSRNENLLQVSLYFTLKL